MNNSKRLPLAHIQTWKNGKTQYAILALICASFFTLSSCKCDDPADPACRNYDPCYELEATSAEFEILELTDWGDTLETPTGRIAHGKSLLLIASQEGLEEYLWKIGSDTTLRRGKEVCVSFWQPYGDIPITLMVKKIPDLACFPNDDGKDTIQKVIKVVSSTDLPIWGVYKGYNQDQPDHLFEIEIRLDSTLNGGSFFILANMYNFPEGCPKLQQLRTAGNGFSLQGTSGIIPSCIDPSGVGVLVSPDSLIIPFSVPERQKEENNNLLNRTFIGIRQ